MLLKPHKPGKNANGGLFIRKKDSKGNPTRFGHTGSSGTNVWIDFEKQIEAALSKKTASK